jgi:hypothetical protein
LSRHGIALLALIGSAHAQDAVVLKDGRKLEGRVVYEDPRILILRDASRERRVELASVASVRSLSRSLNQALDQWLRAEALGASASYDLARFAKASGLPGEAELFAWYAIAADPEFAPAHEMLGHERREKGWSMHTREGWLLIGEIARSRLDWESAWDFKSLHYHVRSNLPVRQAVGIAIDLELAYRAFVQAFGAELDLREVVEPMNIHVHADLRYYPDVGTGHKAFFHQNENLITIDASSNLDLGSIFHEATHQFLYSTAVLPADGRGDIPGWLGEGLAEYIRASASGTSGHARFNLGAVDRERFSVHAHEKDPYELSRVLTFHASDFMSSTRPELKYAQAYTLVHFALHEGEGRWRTGFLGYLRRVYAGQSSSTAFKESMGASESELERAWTAYVRMLGK